MKTKDYDYNIYVLDGVLSLSAYQLEIAPNGHTQIRTDNFKTLDIPMIESNKDEIAYLLDSEEWEDDAYGWDEYDAWRGCDYLTEGDTPAMIAEWVNRLPEYEMLDRSNDVSN